MCPAAANDLHAPAVPKSSDLPSDGEFTNIAIRELRLWVWEGTAVWKGSIGFSGTCACLPIDTAAALFVGRMAANG